MDGSSNAKGSRAGVIVKSPEGLATKDSLQLKFPTSNNQAEYEALLAELFQAKDNGAQRVKVFTDSQLVAAKLTGFYQAKEPLFTKYLTKAKETTAEIQSPTNPRRKEALHRIKVRRDQADRENGTPRDGKKPQRVMYRTRHPLRRTREKQSKMILGTSSLPHNSIRSLEDLGQNF